jgi:putative membrane protein
MKALLIAAAMSSLSLLSAQAASISNTDATYLNSAMQTQLGRYALATLAEKQAASPKLKSLAKSIASDASRESQQLTSLAKQYGVQPPKGPGTSASYHYSQLSGLQGSEFDQRFVQALTMDDGEALDTHQTEARSGSDAKLREFAKQRVSALQHEQKALNSIH